jgi:DNA-binding LacI/PurR family transcriptional regulator
MPTIKDVAQVAGVTVTTVSRVLNNRGYISQATRTKVNEAMKQLNYQPNEIARSLFRGKSNLIGLIIPDVSHPFFGQLTNAIEYHANKFGYKILLCDAYQDSTKERSYIDMLKRHQVEGIIMGSHTLEVTEYLETDLPIVTIDRDISKKIPNISSDNYHGGKLATKLLVDKGCKKLAHISGPLELNTPANKRYLAFMDVVKEENIDYIVKHTELNNFESYENLLYDMFEKYPDIDGIFASSDLVAASIIKVANSIKKEIPKDLKIVGYDDIKLAYLLTPSLTTIRQPIKAMGELAIKILIDEIKGEKCKTENVLPVELIIRETT